MKTYTQLINEIGVPLRKAVAKERAYRMGHDSGMGVARHGFHRSLRSQHPSGGYSAELKNIRGVEAASGVPLPVRTTVSASGKDIATSRIGGVVPHPKLQKEIKRGERAGAKQAKKQYWQQDKTY